MAIRIQSAFISISNWRFLVVSMSLFLISGCQSPWRMWKADDPSLEQLLVRPEPWDAEARMKDEMRRSSSEGRSSDASSSSAMASRSRVSPKTGGPNEPKWYEQVAISDKAELASDELKSNEALSDAEVLSDAEFEAAAAGTPPGLRHLLKRQWDATHAKKTSANNSAAEKSSVEKSSDGQSVSRGQSNANSSSFRLSDDTEEMSHSSEDGEEEFIVQSKTKVRPIRNDEVSVASAESSQSGLQELVPPTRRKSQAVAHAKPRETHMPEQDLVARPTSRKSAASRTDGDYVAPAAAERPVQSDASKQSSSKSSDTEVTEETQKATAKELGWRDLVREALRKKAQERPASPANPVEKLHDQATDRLLSMAIGEIEAALKPIEGLQNNEKDFFSFNFQSIHDAIDPSGNPVLSRRWTLASDSQRKALNHLSAVSNLEIKNATFCTEVTSFGVMSKFPNNQFRPSQQVLLYCELENFVAASVKDGYETQLQGSYEIVDSSGRRVADLLLPPDADFCKNQRRDYFIAYSIYMPEKIEKGRYQLRLTIEDMKARKFGQATLDFQVN